jgi:hypothetical protein
MKSQNLMDFTFQAKKEKHKTISFIYVRSWKYHVFLRRTNHSPAGIT